MAWENLLVPLETRGLFHERGLQLFIHDGGKGLRAALRQTYPHVPHQRCLFHKLRNLSQAISVPDNLNRQAKRIVRQLILAQVSPLLDTATPHTALALRQRLRAQYADSQPDFIATLERDWHETIAFLDVLQRYPHWQRRSLRTTSLLERVNRMLRRIFRRAGACHSLRGWQAATSRVLDPFRLV